MGLPFGGICYNATGKIVGLKWLGLENEMAEKNPSSNKRPKPNGGKPNAKPAVSTAPLKGLGGGPDWNPRQAATQVAAGDIVRLRKPHPCGSYDWKVVRIGADIGLSCIGCEHRVLLTRAEFEKRFKNYLVRASQPQVLDHEPVEAR